MDFIYGDPHRIFTVINGSFGLHAREWASYYITAINGWFGLNARKKRQVGYISTTINSNFGRIFKNSFFNNPPLFDAVY